ncbi:MAG: hypothetical protein KatS3mg008_2190 [Acidimicrobiales bacterium]|nr:MAG: hypothetical protein KatS3mg008_2190 [Acidimicrobiales bacterium]
MKGDRSARSLAELARVRSELFGSLGSERVVTVPLESGRLQIQPGPRYLVVHRRTEDQACDLSWLVNRMPRHLVVDADRDVGEVLRLVVSASGRPPRPFLLVELACLRPRTAVRLTPVWADKPDRSVPEATSEGTGDDLFEVIVEPERYDDPVTERLCSYLSEINLLGVPSPVGLRVSDDPAPDGLGPLLPRGFRRRWKVASMVLQVRQVDLGVGERIESPWLRRRLAKGLPRVLNRCAHEFDKRHGTQVRPTGRLGRRTFTHAARHVDQELSAVASAFDLLLMVTPSNVEQAWEQFRRSGYGREPHFLYRPRRFDADELKRRLHSLQLERVEDATLHSLFHEKKNELDLEISLVAQRGSRRFRHLSVALYGEVDGPLLDSARRILASVRSLREARRWVGHDVLVETARRAVDRMRSQDANFDLQIRLREDVTSLVVSQGVLHVGTRMRFPEHRVRALVEHEVGTHAATWWNGLAQPLRLFSIGLAGFSELQEGLGVFAEAAAGGLDPARMRVLAGRVVAAHALMEGAEFVELFRQLHKDFGFGRRTAFQIAMRIWRGGGFVKDAIYLRGLWRLVNHLHSGGDVVELLVGKVALDHLPLIRELRRRNMVVPPRVVPEWVAGAEAARAALARWSAPVLDADDARSR